jgi:hypothetical protein
MFATTPDTPDPVPDTVLWEWGGGAPDGFMVPVPRATHEVAAVISERARCASELLALRDAVRALVVDAQPVYTSHGCDGSQTCLCPEVCVYCSAKREFHSRGPMEHEPTCPVLAARAHLP